MGGVLRPTTNGLRKAKTKTNKIAVTPATLVRISCHIADDTGPELKLLERHNISPCCSTHGTQVLCERQQGQGHRG